MPFYDFFLGFLFFFFNAGKKILMTVHVVGDM